MPDFSVRTCALLPRLPLSLRTVRLACLIHAASIHPELGSNSDHKNYKVVLLTRNQRNKRKMFSSLVLILTFAVYVCSLFSFQITVWLLGIKKSARRRA